VTRLRPFWLLITLGIAACDQDHTLTIHIVTPLGDDPIATASSLRMDAGGHAISVPVHGGHFNLSFQFETSSTPQVAPVVVDAFAADGKTVLAHGSTPPLSLLPSNGQVWIYVARPGSIGTMPAVSGGGPLLLSPPRSRHAAVYYPGLGIFLAGGRGPDGVLQSSVSLWFHYQLAEVHNALYQLGLPRADLAGALGQEGYLHWVGGADATAEPTSAAEIMDPTGSIPPPYVRSVTATGKPEVARARAAVAVGTEGTLLFGGTAPGGAPAAGAILFTADGGSEPVGWAGAVPRLGATATPILSGAQILIYGGGPAGMPIIERYSSRTSAAVVTTSPMPTPRHEHSATLLADGRVVLLGGLDDGGQPLSSATIYDPTSGSIVERPGALTHARSGHTATRVGGALLVAGGEASGALVAQAELLDARTLDHLAEIPLGTPRVRHTAMDPGNGTVILLGGEDLAGVAVGAVEIFQP
jgi:hypothetical protein